MRLAFILLILNISTGCFGSTLFKTNSGVNMNLEDILEGKQSPLVEADLTIMNSKYMVKPPEDILEHVAIDQDRTSTVLTTALIELLAMDTITQENCYCKDMNIQLIIHINTLTHRLSMMCTFIGLLIATTIVFKSLPGFGAKILYACTIPVSYALLDMLVDDAISSPTASV